jgi:hypothetical protein
MAAAKLSTGERLARHGRVRGPLIGPALDARQHPARKLKRGPRREEADLCIRFHRLGRTRLVNRMVITSDRRVAAWGALRANWIYLPLRRTVSGVRSILRTERAPSRENCGLRRASPDCSATRTASGEARDLLASVYDRFTEGFGTADLQWAKQLLSELA